MTGLHSVVIGVNAHNLMLLSPDRFLLTMINRMTTEMNLHSWNIQDYHVGLISQDAEANHLNFDCAIRFELNKVEIK